MKILFVGDIVGRPGRRALARWLPRLIEEFRLDLIVVNAENAAGGLGANAAVLAELFRMGVHAVTLGNHTWRKKEMASIIDEYDTVIRPANYPEGVPGSGSAYVRLPDGRMVGIMNLLGRVYMEPCECPFRRGRELAARMREKTPVVMVDFHAEATSEKVALGWHLDGLCTAVLGTHTHVQTADERVLPGGTAYITDVGMTGPVDSVIGVERERAIGKFLTGMPHEFRPAKGRAAVCAVVIDVDDVSGRARSIERIYRVDDAAGEDDAHAAE